jgi:RNA polymerase sigma-70 factor (ECF subfamily)
MASAPETLHDRLADGEAAARTEQLFRAHGRVVRGLCIALLRDRAEAEDAAQQVFLSAYKAILNGSEPREPAAWLATIARNECWARARARMREPLPVADVEATAGAQHDPLAEAIRRADLVALWDAIRGLPRQQRDAIVLREFGGLSYDELASVLAVSGAAVESLLFRARRRLREAYAGLGALPWLGRLFSAKAVALGVGAAALSGAGALVPHAFLRSPAAHAHRTAAPVVASAFGDVPAARAPVHAHPAATVARPVRRQARLGPTFATPVAVSSPAAFTPRVVQDPAAPASSASAPAPAAQPVQNDMTSTPPRTPAEDGAQPATTTTDGGGDQSEPTTTTTGSGDSSATGSTSDGSSGDQTSTTETTDGSGGGTDTPSLDG